MRQISIIFYSTTSSDCLSMSWPFSESKLTPISVIFFGD